MNLTKRILAGVSLAMLWAAAILIVGMPAGCASLGDAVGKHAESADTVARIATYAYIRRAGDPQAQHARAARIRSVVAEIEAAQAALGGEPITLQTFTALALERIPSDLTPADKAIAYEFVTLIGTELGNSIGLGGLQSGSLIRLTATLRAVDQAAAFFAPTS